MISPIKANPRDWMKDIYIASKTSIEYDDEGNEIVKYDAPIKYKFTVNDVSSYAELAEFGEQAKITKKIVAPIKYKDTFKEFDVAYINTTPDDETRNGEKIGFNNMIYTESEIERIVRKGFEVAMKRRKKLCSVDKANVLDVSRLWREVVLRVAKEFPEVELSHMYVDNAAMQLIRNPKQFDVIVTENLFGDILSDEASMLTGSLGMLPSASLSENGVAMYEPIHGSAPDFKGQNRLNPIATIFV